MENFEYNNEETTTQEFSSGGGSSNGVTAIKDRVTSQAGDLKNQAVELKGKLTEQARGVADKVKTQATQVTDQLHSKIDGTREKASGGLKSASERIDRMAMYIQETDSRQMASQLVEGSQQYVRQNPGKSLIIGLLAGVVLGRLFGGIGMPSFGHKHRY